MNLHLRLFRLGAIVSLFLLNIICLSSAYAWSPPEGIGLWNTNLRMVNILELQNPLTTRQVYTVSVYNQAGEKFGERVYSLAGNSQRDIVLNDNLLSGRENQVGTVTVRADDFFSMTGRLSYYRWDSTGLKVEFAYSLPIAIVANARFEEAAVPFNSIQPSHNPIDAPASVDQWLSILNVTPAPRKFTIYTYNISGEEIGSEVVYLNYLERRDVRAGDNRYLQQVDGSEREMIGLHRIVPENGEETLFMAQLVRYGKKAAEQEEYSFANPIASLGLDSYNLVAVPFSRGAGADTFVELVNYMPSRQIYGIWVMKTIGGASEPKGISLGAYEQRHISATEYLNEGETGFFLALPNDLGGGRTMIPGGVRGVSFSYYYDSNMRISGATSAQTVMPIEEGAYGTYNLYLESENWIRIFNGDEFARHLTVTVIDELGEVKEKEFYLGFMHGLEIPLHDPELFDLAPDSYGVVKLSGRIGGEILRLGGATAGDIDFVMSTPVGNISIVR